MTAADTFPIPTPRAYAFDAAYTAVPNWDIGRPQRAFVLLEERDLIHGRVLDVGCGTGELSLFLARRGHEVLGIDIAPSAIAQARAKARWRRIPAHYLVWDALDLDGLAAAGFAFETIVDCAMFHLLSASERDRYVEGLGHLLGQGGVCFLLGDARDDPRTPYGITPDEIHARFRAADGWRVGFVTETVFERRHSWNRAFLAGVNRVR